MASLWIRSGYDMKVEMLAETYQVGAHFKALIKAILVAPLKSFERFFRISSSPTGLCIIIMEGQNGPESNFCGPWSSELDNFGTG